MKICKACGKKLDENDIKCPKCNYTTKDSIIIADNDTAYNNAVAKIKKRKRITLICMSIILLAFIAVIAYPGDGNDDNINNEGITNLEMKEKTETDIKTAEQTENDLVDEDTNEALNYPGYVEVKKEYLSAGIKLYIEDPDKPDELCLGGTVLEVNPNYSDDNGNTYYGILFKEDGTDDTYWKSVGKMVSGSVWYVKESDIQEKPSQNNVEEKSSNTFTWISASGNIWIGTELYFGVGDDKMYVGKILNMDDNHYDSVTQKTFRGVELEMNSGSVEWKDRNTIIMGEWYVKSTDPTLN